VQKPPIDFSEGAGSLYDDGPCNLIVGNFVNGKDGTEATILDKVSSSWVIDSCIDFYPKIGLTYEGEKDKMEALLNDIEDSRKQPVTELGGISSNVPAPPKEVGS
jgi:hypothetical protein